jgi:hypothetical protein
MSYFAKAFASWIAFWAQDTGRIQVVFQSGLWKLLSTNRYCQVQICKKLIVCNCVDFISEFRHLHDKSWLQAFRDIHHPGWPWSLRMGRLMCMCQFPEESEQSIDHRVVTLFRQEFLGFEYSDKIVFADEWFPFILDYLHRNPTDLYFASQSSSLVFLAAAHNEPGMLAYVIDNKSFLNTKMHLSWPEVVLKAFKGAFHTFRPRSLELLTPFLNELDSRMRVAVVNAFILRCEVIFQRNCRYASVFHKLFFPSADVRECFLYVVKHLRAETSVMHRDDDGDDPTVISIESLIYLGDVDLFRKAKELGLTWSPLMAHRFLVQVLRYTFPPHTLPIIRYLDSKYTQNSELTLPYFWRQFESWKIEGTVFRASPWLEFFEQFFGGRIRENIGIEIKHIERILEWGCSNNRRRVGLPATEFCVLFQKIMQVCGYRWTRKSTKMVKSVRNSVVREQMMALLVKN